MFKYISFLVSDCFLILKEIILKPTKKSFISLQAKSSNKESKEASLTGLLLSRDRENEKSIAILENKIKQLEKNLSQEIISIQFKYLFIGVLFLSTLTLFCSFYVSLQSSPSTEQKELFKLCLDIFKGCVGAIIGLLGSKFT